MGQECVYAPALVVHTHEDDVASLANLHLINQQGSFMHNFPNNICCKAGAIKSLSIAS
jgi:hypothetical protein